jgi:dolichyl-diphosphooligosaccharide--protein glycosyltransferase
MFPQLCIAGALVVHVRHGVWVTSSVYSSPSIVMAAQNSAGEGVLFDDFWEGYAWLKENTPLDAKVMSW